ncbi:hypothetical protein ATCC90586_008990 [Pythium insidiosum]|nr:hypothetical protein ATCC90586_008990 [Pythium insidiosum]
MGCRQSHAIETSLTKARFASAPGAEKLVKTTAPPPRDKAAGVDCPANRMKEIHYRQYLSNQMLTHVRIR